MIDDLNADAVGRLGSDGLEPCLVIETSPGNFQAWIRLIGAGTVPYFIMGTAARHLVQAYGGDERAVSPRQSGRLAGFTNRKPRHQQADGRFPFVLLALAEPGRVARNGVALLDKLTTLGTAGAAAGRAAETPRTAAHVVSGATPDIMERLDAIQSEQRARIQREVATGRRPIHAGSQSEIDFATARAALQEGISNDHIVAWIARTRPYKEASYPERTITAVETFCATRTRHT